MPNPKPHEAGAPAVPHSEASDWMLGRHMEFHQLLKDSKSNSTGSENYE